MMKLLLAWFCAAAWLIALLRMGGVLYHEQLAQATTLAHIEQLLERLNNRKEVNN
jgi:hypothetical protein